MSANTDNINNLNSEDGQSKLCNARSVMDKPEGKQPWRCEIHGTVTECPWVWMSCDYNAPSGAADAVHADDWFWQPDDGEAPPSHEYLK